MKGESESVARKKEEDISMEDIFRDKDMYDEEKDENEQIQVDNDQIQEKQFEDDEEEDSDEEMDKVEPISGQSRLTTTDQLQKMLNQDDDEEEDEKPHMSILQFTQLIERKYKYDADFKKPDFANKVDKKASPRQQIVHKIKPKTPSQYLVTNKDVLEEFKKKSFQRNI